MNLVFSTKAFWELYFNLESDQLTEDDVSGQLEGLSKNFPVYIGPFTYVDGERSFTVDRQCVEFWFTCEDHYSLVIEYEPNPHGGDKTLFLLDTRTQVKSQLGWWDLAGWHPYCLHWEELDLLLHYWSRAEIQFGREETPQPTLFELPVPSSKLSRDEVSLLLLCQFVGIPDTNTYDTIAKRVKAALLNLNSSEANRDGLDIPLHIPEDNYRWEVDEELGWVFTSDEYCCYSIRNRSHASSEEGSFPFLEFQAMMREVKESLKHI